MDGFVQLKPDERRLFFEGTAAPRNMQPQIVEKDFWVCWTLKELFHLATIGEHLIFKGGTSLSKVFKVIERFSEDIDVSIDRSFLASTEPLLGPTRPLLANAPESFLHTVVPCMKTRYRLFRRRGRIYYCFDNHTQRYTTLNTTDHDAARQIVDAKNLALRQPALSRQIGKVYLASSDPKISTRTWQDALDALLGTKQGVTLERWQRAAKEKALNLIRDDVIIETLAEQFLDVLKAGTVSTNIHLRKLHNFCLDMNWLPLPVLPRKQWPRIQFKPKRGITIAEHQAIVRGEQNPERRAFYELAWYLGAAQSDLAALTAENIHWCDRVIRFFRKKTRSVAVLRFSDEVAELLRALPQTGSLFPEFSQLRESHRATEFKRACKRLGISGVTLHSYRYAWAERAKNCGYPERFAQTALGHNSRAVHEAYAGGAIPTCPPLDDYARAMKEKVIPLHVVPAACSKAQS